MSKKNNLIVVWFLVGVASVFFVKYVLFGLDRWNSVFHPARIEGQDVEEYKKGLL
jgi:hypothetical protein